ncbi:MAG: PEP-CTERM sorting domain-containing protein [Opitutales bacterium]|nr:PEP-CTERM sorting domain-containing protein [Opitutales bacterium]
MKKYLTVAAFLSAGAAFSNADVQGFDSLNFGTGTFATDYSFSFVVADDYSLATDGSVVAYYGGSAYQSTYGSNVFQLVEADGALSLKYGVGTMNGGLTSDSDIRVSTGVSYLRGGTFATRIEPGVVYTVTGANGANQSIDITLSWKEGSALVERFNGNMNGNTSVQWARVNSAYAIPEPSAFGMLVGLGALALVASRRSRPR